MGGGATNGPMWVLECVRDAGAAVADGDDLPRSRKLLSWEFTEGIFVNEVRQQRIVFDASRLSSLLKLLTEKNKIAVFNVLLAV